MTLENHTASYIVVTIMLFCIAGISHALQKQDNNDWSVIWRRKMPKPVTVEVGKIVNLGKNIGNRKWQMISTRYHQIHYQPSMDTKKLSEIYFLIDNVYEFLKGRSPTKLAVPIKVFLVPNVRGYSRCSKISNAMRTGDQGDSLFMLASILHEETHMFNFAFLGNSNQGWWTGEFFCQYFQNRALWDAQGKDIKKQIMSRLPTGPQCRLSEIGKKGKEAFEEAFSALYFFEEKYGRGKLNLFRRACLEKSRRTGVAPLPESTFARVFGLDVDQLEQQWKAFYGWGQTKPQNVPPGRLQNIPPVLDPRLETKVSYTVAKASVQKVVQAMAEKAGLRYNWTKSASQIGSLSKQWIENVQVNNRPLHEALMDILDPRGLTYKLEEGAIVLYKK